jgi:hypothetical protein
MSARLARETNWNSRAGSGRLGVAVSTTNPWLSSADFTIALSWLNP